MIFTAKKVALLLFVDWDNNYSNRRSEFIKSPVIAINTVSTLFNLKYYLLLLINLDNLFAAILKLY